MTVRRLSVLTAAILALVWTGSSAGQDSGVIGEWHFDEGSGLRVADSSGNNNDGTLTGGVSWIPGRFGSALSFDGTGRVRVVDNVALEPASQVTVSAWVRSQGSPGDYRYVVAKGATGCIAASYGLYSGPDGGLVFYVSSHQGTTYSRSPDAGVGVWDDQWHMAVGTFDGSTIRLFVDGHEVGNVPLRPGALEYLLPDSNDLYIGDYPGCDQHRFVGAIDEVGVWDRALTQAEVAAAFPEPSDSPPTGGQPSTPPPGANNPGAGAAPAGHAPRPPSAA